MTQEHNTRLPQCEQQFVQHSHDVQQMCRSVDKIAAAVADLKTASVLMHESQATFQKTISDSQVAQDKRCKDEMTAQETRVQLSISRVWRAVWILMGCIGIGGGGAAANQFLF